MMQDRSNTLIWGCDLEICMYYVDTKSEKVVRATGIEPVAIWFLRGILESTHLPSTVKRSTNWAMLGIILYTCAPLPNACQNHNASHVSQKRWIRLGTLAPLTFGNVHIHFTLHYELTIRRYIFYPDSFRQYALLPLKADLLILRIFPGHLCLAGTSCFLHDKTMVECPVILASQTSCRYWNSPSMSSTLLRGSWHLVWYIMYVPQQTKTCIGVVVCLSLACQWRSSSTGPKWNYLRGF